MKKNKKIGRAVCAADLGSGWERGFVLRKALWCVRVCIPCSVETPTPRRGAGGERNASCFFAGIFIPGEFLANYGPKVSKGRAESPLVRPQAHPPRPQWSMTRRLRRGRRACSPMGRSMLQVAVRRGAGGNGGKRVSCGYNRRRRLAPGRSGKQQAERTAVRAAPLVCPEDSHQCARRRIHCPIGTPTPRRGCRGGTEGSGYPVDTTAEGG